VSKQYTGTILKKLLLQHSGRYRFAFAWPSLWAGISLLLLSVTAWLNFREILHGKSSKDSLGSTFVTISKSVAPGNAARSQGFTPEEIQSLLQTPQVQDAGALTPATFPATISIGGSFGFSTLLPLEAVPGHFIDADTDDWRWEEGMLEVPIILSSELLNQYNYVFAPSQGLPLLTEDAVKALAFRLEIGAVREPYTVRIVGLSDRITSVLVPESFIRYGNTHHGSSREEQPSRLILKATDPSDQAFVQYLEARHYQVNAEQLRWNKLRAALQFISLAGGLFAIALTGISAMVFLLFIELTLVRAREDLQLLLQLGYSPGYLRRFVARRFVPLLLSAVFLAIAAVALAQVFFCSNMQQHGLETGRLPGWPVWALATVCLTLLLWLARRTIRKAAN
jgi:hypothetical protein